MRVGITGSYASGKSTVCEMFENLGAIHIDTDIIAREIVEPGKNAYNNIVAEFGKKILNEDRSINRKTLAEIVFKDKNQLKLLNSITHSEILKLVKSRSLKKSKIYVINTPLLFESEYNKQMDYNVTIISKVRQSIERGQKRDGFSKKDIKLRLKHQFSIKEKVKMSDYVIDNSHSIENTKRQVDELWKILTRLKSQR